MYPVSFIRLMALTALFLAVCGGTGNPSRKGLAAFTTSGALTGWSPDVNGSSINSLVSINDTLYVDGNSTSVIYGGHTVVRSQVAAFDSNAQLLDK
jgi:hypothetical protein